MISFVLLAILWVALLSIPFSDSTSAWLTQFSLYNESIHQICEEQFHCTATMIEAAFPMPWMDFQLLIRTHCRLTDDAGGSSALAQIEKMRFHGCDRSQHNDRVSFLTQYLNKNYLTGRGVPNCQYDVQITAGKGQYHWIIAIHQHSCKCTNALYNGGTTFQIFSDDTNQHMVCHFVQFTLQKYVFHCVVVIDENFFPRKPAVLSDLTRYHMSLDTERNCVNISVVVHFEAFDGISESAFTSLGYTVYTQQHCSAHPLPLPAHLAELKPWLSNAYNSTIMRECLGRYRRMVFLGASHMRYIWQVLVHQHVDNATAIIQAKIDHDPTVLKVDYFDVKFLADIPAMLLGVCYDVGRAIDTMDPANPPFHKVIVQTGAWDLSYYTMTYIMASKGWAAVWETIDMIGQLNCSRFMSIQFLSTVPPPMGTEARMRDRIVERYGQYLTSIHLPDVGSMKNRFALDMRGLTEARGYRTLPAIAMLSAAIAAHIESITYPSRQIQEHWQDKLTAPSSKLTFVDSFTTMSAFAEETANPMHFLAYRPGAEDPVYSSLGGEILFATVCKAVCEQ